MHRINRPPETTDIADTVMRGEGVFPIMPRDRCAAAKRRPHLLHRLVHLRFPVLRNVSLSARLMLLVLAGVVPLLIFNLVMVYGDFRDDRARAFRQTMMLSRAIAQSTEGFLNARIADLVVLADSPALEAGDLDTFRTKAERAVRHQFPGDTLVLSRRDGRQLICTGVLTDSPLPNSEQFAGQ